MESRHGALHRTRPLPDAAVPEAVDNYVAADNPTKLFVLRDVALWILVHRLNASDVGCIEHREADCEVVPQLERGVDAKVGQALSLFLTHMIAIGLVGPEYGRMPALAPNSVTGNRCDRVADLIVILDRILGLVRRGGFASRTLP